MQEISAYELIKEKLHAIPNSHDKGSLFEKISKQFLQEHDSANEYESIDLWYDWKLRGKERDKGIDIVIQTASKEYIAVQCKFHQNSISYNDISPFLTQLQSGVGEVRFKKGIIISTSNLTSEALKAIEQIRSTGMGIDIDEITEEDFIYSRIDWEKFDPTKTEDEIPLCDKKRPRPHQTEAIEKTKEYFSNPKNARGKLIMACGTGKTYTSLKIMEALDPKITLFLAPSIALLSQTFREYAQEKSEPFYASIVCSDDKTGQSNKNKSKDETDDIKFSELPLKPSTRLEDILSTYEKAQKENKHFIIFSTYQSALRIKEAQEAGLNGIDLIICDEAHRTVGAMYSSNERDDKNAFTLCHSDENIKATKRLYMTATPKVYSESSKAKAKESDNVIYSMDDADTFGEEIYTLNFEKAIALDLLTDYKVIILAVRKENLWKVIKALRSHDPSLVDEATFKEKIKIFGSDDGKKQNDEKTLFDAILLQDLANAVYNVMPTKLGDRNYWENFTKKTGNIARTLNNRLKMIFDKNPEFFRGFLDSLRENIHQNIKEEEALDMITSHIITKPIFDAIFGDNIKNPIAKALDKMVLKLSSLGLQGETKELKNLYESVKTEAAHAKSQKSQQELIKNLYNTFFKVAFRKQSEKLGIVYTPIEVVDFILRATNGILKKHFNTDFNDQNITIFDPFTGTGSFIARLLSKENNLISDEALKEKFQKNLFAFDIVLLSYYIALINITQAAQNRDGSLKNFKNIALTDSLDYLEEKTNKGVLPLYEDLKENQEIKTTMEKQNIRVIIGNPPYSAGAKSENDNNQNLKHPKLEKRVYEKYGTNSTAKVGATTRDTLIQSIRVASDLLKDKGVLGFVVNGGFIDSKSADGFRKCVAQEFAHLYVLNLRGNARTSGETFRKEGGKIFDSGSRATIAIIFFVKDASVKNSAIHYYDIGDNLKREDKLNRLANFTSLDAIAFETIIPNNKGDWINQRDNAFEKLIPLKRDKERQNPSVFDINSGGVVSGRDPWVYNFSPNALMQSVQNCIDTYNADLKRFNVHFREAFKQRAKGVKSADLYKQLNDSEITTDKTKIAWTDDLKNNLIKNKNLQESHKDRIRLALYRPFNKQWLYWDKDWINRQREFSKIFPNKDAQNVVINTGVGNGKDFNALVSDAISDYGLISPNQAYPLYYYDDLGNRHNAISGYALNLFRRHYKDNSIVEEEIFYYIYAIFHHKGYLEKYKNSLAKEAPRVALSEDFKELSMLGKELAELHLNYENGEMHTSVKHNLLENAEMEGYYDVIQMKKDKKGDRILYNQNITITQIPKKAFDYVVNGKSAIDWVIERYSITKDKDSLIENNPNHYAGGKYVFELLCRVIKLSEKSVDLIEKISEKRFE
ncbi:type ISP restriction/modification enzyme [Helicobacter pylori]